jgi:hypothetical protein
MKSKLWFLLISLLLILCCNNLYANFGVKIGPHYSFVIGNAIQFVEEGIPAWRVGVFINFKVSRICSIQTEIYYAIKGIKRWNKGITHTETVKLKYIEIPLLLRIQPREGNIVLYFGPYYGYLLEVPPRPQRYWNWIPEEAVVRRGDLGVSWGGGFLLRQHFIIEAQCNIGLTNVVYNPNLDHYQKNLTLALLVGFQF